MRTLQPPEIVVGLSGGVDSSVAALLLRDSGVHTEALFMSNWDTQDPECRSEPDRRDAVAIAGQLGMRLHFRDFSREYMDGVFRHFLAEYAAGRTPNPDVLCNREVKFSHFLAAARQLGAEAIATGHYARVDRRAGKYRLLRARDLTKDQSYFLHLLGQDALAATRFPLGEIDKDTVRRMAAAAGLATASKKDSTGICFIGERDFRSFLAQWLPMQRGEIRTPAGEVLGSHDGVYFHTIGQRGGLGLGGMRGRPAEPWYVVGKDVKQNILYVEQGKDSHWLLSRRLHTESAHWIAGSAPARQFDCLAQVRYRQVAEPCQVSVLDDGTLETRFFRPQRAVTPGQSLVLYDQQTCLGGAVIRASDAPLDTLSSHD